MVQKKVALENKGWLGETVYSVASDFGTGTHVVVTLILESADNSNAFWNKHVLRLDENPSQILAARRSLKDKSAANLAYAAAIGVPVIKKGKPHNLNMSTTIDIARVDPKQIVYRIAKALVLEVNKGAKAPGDRIDVSVDFKTDKAATTVETSGAQSWSRGALLGGDFVANSGGAMTFSIDHLDGAAF